MGGIFSFLVNLVFPKYCLSCDKAGEYLCSDCRFNLPHCKDLALIIRAPIYFDEAYFLFDYDEAIIKNLITSLKYRFVKEIANYLGELLALKIKELNLNGTLVPVPLHKRRQNWRGFNQTEEICKVISKECGFEIAKVLLRKQYHAPQAKLNEEDRLKSLDKAFIKTGDVPPVIILIDDVVTTGATVNECSRVLKTNGAEKIIVLAFAKG